MLSTDDLLEWIRHPTTPVLPRGKEMELLHLLHPKCVFFKTLPSNAKVLDLGGGQGGLSGLKAWPDPPRPDIKLYVFSLVKGEHFDRYDGWELGNWEKQRPDFKQMTFDAVFCANFIEHISDPLECLEWCASRLTKDGRMYFEWPSPYAINTPKVADLKAAGIRNVMMTNYFDDRTHKPNNPDKARMVETLERRGFIIDQSGYIHLPYIEEQILAHHYAAGEDKKSQYPMTAAVWSKTRFIQYLVAARDAM